MTIGIRLNNGDVLEIRRNGFLINLKFRSNLAKLISAHERIPFIL